MAVASGCVDSFAEAQAMTRRARASGRGIGIVDRRFDDRPATIAARRERAHRLREPVRALPGPRRLPSWAWIWRTCPDRTHSMSSTSTDCASPTPATRVSIIAPGAGAPTPPTIAASRPWRRGCWNRAAALVDGGRPARGAATPAATGLLAQDCPAAALVRQASRGPSQDLSGPLSRREPTSHRSPERRQARYRARRPGTTGGLRGLHLHRRVRHV